MKLEDIKSIHFQCSLHANYYDSASRPLSCEVHYIEIVTYDGCLINLVDALEMVLWEGVNIDNQLYNLLLMVREAASNYDYKSAKNISEECDLWVKYYNEEFAGMHDRYKQFYNFDLTLDMFKDIEMEIKYFPFRIKEALEEKFTEAFKYFHNKAKELTI
jgi:hypothetical protein